MARKAESLVVTDLSIEIANALQRLGQFDKAAAGVDKRLSNLVKTANAAEKALNKLGGKGVKVNIEADTSAISSAETDIKALDNLSPKIDVQVNVDEEQAQTELKSLEAPSLKVDVSVDEQSVQTELNSLDAPDINVPVNTDVSAAQTIINSMTAPKLKVDVEADTSKAKADINSIPVPDLKTEVKGDTSAIEKQLEDLKNLAKIDLVFTVAGTGLNVAKSITGLPVISEINDTAEAVRELEASTGRAIPGAEKLITDVFSAGNWGATKSEVAGVIAEVSKFEDVFGSDFAATAITAFQTVQATGGDFVETLDAMRTLVASGLVPDSQAAGDLIVSALQKGGDVAGDALDTLREYSSQFAQVGIDGATALDLIIQGLQLGTRNSDALGDAFKEMNLRITTATGEGAGTEFDALTSAGLYDEAQAVAAGEMTGTQFAAAAVQALKDGVATEQNLYDIFGSPLENFGIDIFKNLDFGAAENAIIPEGAAEDAANLLNNNLGSAFQNLGRVLQQDVIDKLKAAGVDINQFLTDATNKLYEISALITSGESFPDAIAIALDSPELGKDLHQLESFMGDFIIELMTAFANAGEFLHFDVSGIRDTIADLGAQQLAYNIAIAPDDLSHVEFNIQQALRRGVDSAEIGEQVAQSAQDLIDKGDLAAAQQLLDTVEAIPTAYAKFTAVARGSGEVENVILPIEPEIADDPAAIQAKIDEYLATVGDSGGYQQGGLEIDLAPTIDTEAIQGVVEGARSDALTALKNAGDFFTGLFEGEPPLSTTEAANIAAGALAAGDLATALQAANDAGWPITEDQLQTLADSSDGYYDLQNKLTAYGQGLEAAKTDGTAALATLKTEGIDVVDTAMNTLNSSTDAYVLGVQGGLEVAKVSWQDYLDWLKEHGLTMFEDGSVGLSLAPGVITTGDSGTTPHVITTPGTEGFDGGESGGKFKGTFWTGEAGPELVSSDVPLDVLNNVSSSALMAGVQAALHGGMGSGSSTVINNYNNIALNNTNNNAAQRMGSDIRFLNRVRGSL